MIAGLALLDVIRSSETAYDGERPPELELRLANELVVAAVDEMKHIEALDVCGPTRKWRRVYVRETEEAMRALYTGWLGTAQPLLERVRSMSASGSSVPQLTELEMAVLLARGLLMMTVDELEAAKEDARRGNVVSIEEVRRELRARAAS